MTNAKRKKFDNIRGTHDRRKKEEIRQHKGDPWPKNQWYNHIRKKKNSMTKQNNQWQKKKVTSSSVASLLGFHQRKESDVFWTPESWGVVHPDRWEEEKPSLLAGILDGQSDFWGPWSDCPWLHTGFRNSGGGPNKRWEGSCSQLLKGQRNFLRLQSDVKQLQSETISR